MGTGAFYTVLPGRRSYMSAITDLLPFCLKSIVSLCRFLLQQASVKETQKCCSSKYWHPQSGKQVQGTRDSRFLTFHAPKSCGGKQNHKTWNVFSIDISSSSKQLNSCSSTLKCTHPCQTLQSEIQCAGCTAARNRKQKGKKIKIFLNSTSYAKDLFLPEGYSRIHSKYFGMLLSPT